MPITVTARDGDCLCSLAQGAGFFDCRKLREEAANSGLLDRLLVGGDRVTVPDREQKEEDGPTTTKHRFKSKATPPASIRFVHGSPDKKYKDDFTLTVLDVSKYVTDQGGNPDGDVAFPDGTVFEFDQRGHRDLDDFKVEVFDPSTKKTTVEVVLEALRPVLDAAGKVTGHTEFDGSLDDPTTDRGIRNLRCTAKKQGQTNTMRFRTNYLRLVVDEADKNGTVGAIPPNTFPPPTANQPRPAQTLFVSDMTDEGDDKVEILDQRVRASYEFVDCTATPKCQSTATLPIGTDRRRVRVALHVLRTTVGGDPVVTLANAERRVKRWLRRVLAQSGFGPKLVLSREVDPVGNLVAIGDPGPNAPANAGGRRATGDGGLGFTIDAPGLATQVVGPLTPPANQTALATATALAGLVTAPYSARVSPNPRRFNDANASADILITAQGGAVVSLSGLVSNDSAQTLSFGNANPLPQPQQSWDGFNFLVGSTDQRVLLKNLKSGADRIDVFVIHSTSDGNRGEAMMHGHSVNANAATHGLADAALSLFVIPSTMDAGDADPLVLAHELGHVLADVIHATQSRRQLMHAQVTGNHDVGASKRIRNSAVVYDNSTAAGFNLVGRLRSETPGVIEPW